MSLRKTSSVPLTIVADSLKREADLDTVTSSISIVSKVVTYLNKELDLTLEK